MCALKLDGSHCPSGGALVWWFGTCKFESTRRQSTIQGHLRISGYVGPLCRGKILDRCNLPGVGFENSFPSVSRGGLRRVQGCESEFGFLHEVYNPFCLGTFWPLWSISSFALLVCCLITKGSVSYLSSPCFSTIIGGIGGPARGKRSLLDVMH